MAYDRNEYSGRNDRDPQDYGRDFGSGRDYSYSSARDYRATGEYGSRDDRNFRGGGTGYGDRDYRPDNWGSRGGGDDQAGRGGYGRQQWSGDDGGVYRGSYASDGHRFTDTGDHDRQGGYGNRSYAGYGRDRDDRGHNDRGRQGGGRQGYGRPPQGYDYQDRGFMARAGDEVRSWFGDEDAERRREFDQRYDERLGGQARDDDYHSWRRGQIDALDRDYGEYRRENAKKFESEFGAWRSNRQTQRDSLTKVTEHMEVVGSDGAHVGTVDKVRGDRIILTKNDTDAGGRHHSIPSSWITTVDDKVTISKSADEAQSQWRDEERATAMFGEENRGTSGSTNRDDDARRGTDLNRSFSGTY